jgi:hypothetical protein
MLAVLAASKRAAYRYTRMVEKFTYNRLAGCYTGYNQKYNILHILP